MAEPRDRGPRKDYKDREPRTPYKDRRDKSPEIYIKRENKSPKADWVSGYITDMANLPTPEDWVSCAKYQLEGISTVVDQIEVLDWNPTHVDIENRMVDEATLWCSALVDGQPYGIILHLGPEVKIEVVPGKAKDMKSPL